MIRISATAIAAVVAVTLGACAQTSYPPEPEPQTADSARQSAQASGSDAFETAAEGPSFETAAEGPNFETAAGGDAEPLLAAVDPGHSLARETQLALTVNERAVGTPIITAPSRNRGAAQPAQPAAPVGAAQPGQTALPVAVGNGGFVRPGDVIEVRFFRNTKIQGDRYGIEVGDVLRVDVVDHPDVSRERVLVLPDGHISLPLVGSIRAAGKDVDFLSRELAQRFESERILKPQVSVAVEQSDRRLETLFGIEGGGGPASLRIAVTEEGVIALPFIPPIQTVGQPMADLLQSVRAAYWREFSGRLEVTANVIERGGVPVVYVMGEVRQPTVVAHNSLLNPMMALAAAGGPTPEGEPEDVRVIRAMPDGNYMVYSFNIESDIDGESQDAAGFRLQPQDVVYVRPSGIAEANRWVQQYIVRMLPFDFGMNVVFAP